MTKYFEEDLNWLKSNYILTLVLDSGSESLVTLKEFLLDWVLFYAILKILKI